MYKLNLRIMQFDYLPVVQILHRGKLVEEHVQVCGINHRPDSDWYKKDFNWIEDALQEAHQRGVSEGRRGLAMLAAKTSKEGA